MSLSVRLALVLVLTLAGAGLSYVLLMHHHGEQATAQVCGGPESGCDTVNRSPWANVAGIPLAAIGIVFYLSVAVLALGGLLRAPAPSEVNVSPDIRPGVGALALVFFVLAIGIDVLLFGIQALRIGVFCKLCLITYGINIVAASLLFTFRGSLGAIRRLARAEGRTVAVTWAIATVVFAFGAWGAERALAEREAQRGANILGGPIAAAPAATSDAPTRVAEAAAATPDPRKAGAPAAPAQTDAQLKAAQEEIKRLKQTLEDPQKYEEYQHEKSLRDFADGPAQAINLADSPVMGPKEAKIKVVEYADFLCPYCRNIARAFHDYLPQSDNRVAIYYKFYPLDSACNASLPRPVHAGACALAMGGVCAQKQGQFGPYQEHVVVTEFKEPTKDDVIKLAGELKFDVASFTTCMNAPATKDRVVADVTEGAKAGVTGTPTIFINGRRLPRINEFLDAIDQESQKLGMGPMPKPSAPNQPPQKK